jgi:hypothetical protein
MRNLGARNTAKILLISCVLVGCNDRYQDGYSEGYGNGYDDAQSEARTRLQECESQRPDCAISETSAYSYSTPTVTTEVCGGNGVTVNGKHHRPGKTGCVRVYSDGTSQRY